MMLYCVNNVTQLVLKQGSEQLCIIDQQESQYLNQYRAVLDAQRHSNSSLSADCEQIQERYV